jgi:exocyst complex component 4
LQAVQRDWDIMASDDCVPVQVGLQLMDYSTLGKADREPDFMGVHKKIQKTLRSIVNGRLQIFRSKLQLISGVESDREYLL